jgi:transcription elongation factor Elf1
MNNREDQDDRGNRCPRCEQKAIIRQIDAKSERHEVDCKNCGKFPISIDQFQDWIDNGDRVNF